MADSPEHYTRGKIEVWDFIRDQDLNYHLGNAIKYICRAGHKAHNSKQDDLKKAIHYLENELQHTTSYESMFERSGLRVPFRVRRPEWPDEPQDAALFDR